MVTTILSFIYDVLTTGDKTCLQDFPVSERIRTSGKDMFPLYYMHSDLFSRFKYPTKIVCHPSRKG